MNGSKSFVRSRARGASPTFWGRRCGGGGGRLGVQECVRNCNASDLRLGERVWRGNWGDGAMDRGARSGMEGFEERGAALRGLWGVRVPWVPSGRCDL